MNINLDKLGELCYSRDLRVVVRTFDCWQVSIVMDENGHVVYFQCRSRGAGTLCWAEYNVPLMIKLGLLELTEEQRNSGGPIEASQRYLVNENHPAPTFAISTPESKQQFGKPMPSGLYMVVYRNHDDRPALCKSCFSQSEQRFYDDDGLPSIINSHRITNVTEVE